MTSNPVKICRRCQSELDPPRDVQPGRPAEFCSERCRRQAEFFRRRAARWERLASEWRQRPGAGATAAAERCEAIADRLRGRSAGTEGNR
jgi:hypothetical protein